MVNMNSGFIKIVGERCTLVNFLFLHCTSSVQCTVTTLSAATSTLSLSLHFLTLGLIMKPMCVKGAYIVSVSVCTRDVYRE